MGICGSGSALEACEVSTAHFFPQCRVCCLMNRPPNPGLLRLEASLRALESVVVAFSGGVDSAVVAVVAHRVLGDRAVAVTAVSETFPPEELQIASEVCQRFGVRHVLIETRELESEGYARNEGNRCYFCKSELFELARRKADELGIPHVADGTIPDDLGDHRPGLAAAGEQAVLHPLVDAQIDKAGVREIARELGIPVWDKPSFACLGSRFSVGTRVTAPRVRAVRAVESYLRTVGVRHFRARWHELDGKPLLRLEVGLQELPLMVDPAVRQGVSEVARAEGFSWVTLDLEGYQKGRGSQEPSATSPPGG